MISKRTVAIGFSLVLAAAAGLAAQKVEVKTEGGLTVVRNPKKPVPQPGGPSRLELAEELVIGKSSEPSKYVFASLRSVDVDAAGGIWTLDNKDVKIRVFDPKGTRRLEFGTKGQGPGELQTPRRLLVRPDGGVMIHDSAKIMLLSSEGRLLRELSTAQAGAIGRVFMDARGFVYGDAFETEPEKRLVRFLFKKFDADMNFVGIVASCEVRMPEGVDPLMPRFLGTLDAAGRVTWAMSTVYEFQVLDEGGKLVRKVIKDYDPVPITADEQKKIIQDRFGGSTEIQLHFEPAYPPIASFVGDDEGRLYVRTYARDGRGGVRHDVFNAEGRCVLQFMLPEAETVCRVRNGKLYTLVEEDEEGRPLVKRYGMIWK